MRLCIIFLLLFASALFLPAQNNADIFIYIPPVAGMGSTRDDNAIIAAMLAEEIKARNYFAIESQQKADFSLIGTLGPYRAAEDESGHMPVPDTDYLHELWLSDETGFDEDVWYDEYDSLSDNTEEYGYYVFYVTLKDEAAQEVLAEQYMIYSSLEELSSFFSLFMLNVFSRELDRPGEDTDAWRNKWLYTGLSAFWTPRIYYGDEQSTHFINFGGGLTAEFHFLNFMSVAAGVELAPDWIVTATGTNDSYRNLMLEIPLALKLVFKPSTYFILEPYGGIHLNFPLYPETSPALLSWMAGFQYGVKAGPGVFFIDPRFSRDIGDSGLYARSNSDLPRFERVIFHIGIGYKLGFLTRPAKNGGIPR